MARTRLSIRVDLVRGSRGAVCGRGQAGSSPSARSHSFAALASAIDDAFARWDLAHLHEFRLADGTRLTTPYGDDDEIGPSLDDRRTKLSRLGPGGQFIYTFDLGDAWTHLCTVGPERIDPPEELGVVPAAPLALFGWGDMPDQYGRRWDADDGEGPVPEDPGPPDISGFLRIGPPTGG